MFVVRGRGGNMMIDVKIQKIRIAVEFWHVKSALMLGGGVVLRV
jgi:hypothetical protein